MSAWPTAPLSSVAAVFNGKTPSAAEQRTDGLPVLKIKDVSEDGEFRGRFDSFVDEEFAFRYANKRIESGDVLILNAAHNAEYVGSKLFFAGEQVVGAFATGEWMLMRANSEQLRPGFLFRYMQSCWARALIKSLVRGIHLYPVDVARISIPLAPAVEQERIVRILDEAEALRRIRREASHRTDEARLAIFAQMFGDPLRNGRWPIQPLGKICGAGGIKAGPFGSSLKKESYTATGPRVYGQEQVIAGDFSVGDYHIRAEKFAEMRAYAVQAGDVLVSLVGTIGRAVVVPHGIEPGIINPRLLRIRPPKAVIAPEFLVAILTSQSAARFFESIAGGITMGVLNATLLKELRIIVPPSHLQEDYAARVAEIRTLEVAQAASRKRLDDLFQSLLRCAFQGEL